VEPVLEEMMLVERGSGVVREAVRAWLTPLQAARLLDEAAAELGMFYALTRRSDAEASYDVYWAGIDWRGGDGANVRRL
jgi:hypothetical protein